MTRQLLRRTAALGVAAALGASALMALPSAPAAAATIGTLTFYIEAPYTPPFTLDSPYHAQTSAACPSTNFFMKLDGPGVPDDAGFAQGNTEGAAVGGINGGPFNFPVQNTLRSWATVNGFAGGQLPSGTYTYTLTCTDAFGDSNEGEFVGQVKVSGNNVTSGPFSALGKAPVVKTKPKIKGTTRVGQKLTATHGKWKPKPDGYGYKWKRGSKVLKSGPNATSYALKKKDKGHKITLVVKAKKSGHLTGKVSVKSDKVKRAK